MRKKLNYIVPFVIVSAMLIASCSAYVELYNTFTQSVFAEIEYSDPQTTSPGELTALTLPDMPKIIDAPFIYQEDRYPNGCESVSAVMALQYLSFDITVDEFIDVYLDTADVPVVGGIGEDPNIFYLGDPRSTLGWGCFSPAIATAISRVVDYNYFTVDNSCGQTLDELCKRYIDKDIPVLIWATVDMQNSQERVAYWYTEDGRRIEYNTRLHCVLLVGYDRDYYYFNDPKHIGTNTPYVAYSKDKAERAYELLGMQSVAVYAKN
ncbi:MAG: C39 family peptidase [Clostridia bacterium]|nr:C39 family peptidase [Clostridia bacterium]